MDGINSGEWRFNCRCSRNNKEGDYYFSERGGLYVIAFFIMFLYPWSFLKWNGLSENNGRLNNCWDNEFPPVTDMKLLKEYMREMISAPLCLLSVTWPLNWPILRATLWLLSIFQPDSWVIVLKMREVLSIFSTLPVGKPHNFPLVRYTLT